MTRGGMRRKRKAEIMKSLWITHKGAQILHLHYDHFGDDSDALQAEVNEGHHEVMKQPLNSVLELVDLTDTVGSKRNVEILKAAVAESKAHIRKVAVIGISGIRQLIVQGVARITGMGFTLFDDEEKAKDWLVGEK
jgi:hypothetical protein